MTKPRRRGKAEKDEGRATRGTRGRDLLVLALVVSSTLGILAARGAVQLDQRPAAPPAPAFSPASSATAIVMRSVSVDASLARLEGLVSRGSGRSM